ncbi:MAG: hypothetical protein MUO62_16890 [Anaerolineales bacterium]|nr:hypothetical protein [Anaerolineales bacterium]
MKASRNLFPFHGWVGLGLVATAWPLIWLLAGPRAHWTFFFLWTGYSLLVDALVFKRTGTSLLTRSRRKYVGLFLVSAPAWWLFELLNWRVANWSYLGRGHFSDLAYGLLATLAFSTVIPAVFGTAELVASLSFFKRPRRGPRIAPARGTTLGFFSAGWVMLALMLAWPRYFFPFIWLSVYFILEPLNIWLGYPNLALWTRSGDWRPVLALWGGVLVTGFFWEFWNFWSYPKWVYTVPFVDFWHVFEMPLLGYGGYLPFALELHALYHLVVGLLGDGGSEYIRFEFDQGG